MSALAHYLEEEGIATTLISLVREHTAAIKPPRALWVPFMLGRPLGVPNDAAFQRRVLLAALNLLERPHGPVLEDFPDDAPHEDLGPPQEGLVCPISFPSRPQYTDLAQALVDEVAQLSAWHDLAIRARGRTTVGTTGLDIDTIVAWIAEWLEGIPPEPYNDELRPGPALKMAAEELKAYYLEARAMQPGRHASRELYRWLWCDTVFGDALFKLREIAAASDDASMKPLAGVGLVPRMVEAEWRPRTKAAAP